MVFKVYSKEIFIVKIVAIIGFSFIFIGCGSTHYQHSAKIFKGYSGPERSSDEIAMIILGIQSEKTDFVDWLTIESSHIELSKYGAITIPPGTYSINFGRKFNISPMIKASGSDERKWSTTVTLESGHKYIIHAERTVGPGYIIYSWIEDNTIGNTIWGKEYVPGPYDHLKGKYEK